MFASTINLTIFIMMFLIYLNEMKNISMFIFKFKYIKDLSKIIMEQKCNNIYCEAETDRYQISKNCYNLLLPNDIFNSKTYIIMTFIVSIMIYIYYYYKLFDNVESLAKGVINLILLSFIILMICVRYIPYDEQGYLNYFKYSDAATGLQFYLVFGFIIIIGSVFYIKYNEVYKNLHFPTIYLFILYILSIFIIYVLMNIVMSFRNNTKPTLKTKDLNKSLQLSFDNVLEKLNEKDKNEDKTKENNPDYIYNEYIILDNLNENLKKKYFKEDVPYTGNGVMSYKKTILYLINILKAFNELLKIKEKYVLNKDVKDVKTNYILGLKNIIKENNALFIKTSDEYDKDKANKKDVIKKSDVSFIFDNTSEIPAITINNDDDYTADISYNSPNLFYEKYSDIDVDNSDDLLFGITYDIPNKRKDSKGIGNLSGIGLFILIFIIIIILFNIVIYFGKLHDSIPNILDLYIILQPFIMFILLIIFITIFIVFNTKFNKNVIYKCLDCSYKRSLNNLNNIISPYIRMYDRKIINSQKSYIHHYIIANIFYSILSGNIILNKKYNLDYPSYNPNDPSYNPNDPLYNPNVIDNLDFQSIENLNFAKIDNNIIDNNNIFKKYYETLFNKIYTDADVTKAFDVTKASQIEKIFKRIFPSNLNILVGTVNDKTKVLDYKSYFEKIFSSEEANGNTLFEIFKIIKICFNIFDENKFDLKDKDIYSLFKFYKVYNKQYVIPYQFKLILSSYPDIIKFSSVYKGAETDSYLKNDFNEKLTKYFKINIDIQKSYIDILDDPDNNDDDINNPDRNLIKIIAKFLLILGHINYNSILYTYYKQKTEPQKTESQNTIYTKKYKYLYKLISSTIYDDSYIIDDTFDYTLANTLENKIKDEDIKYKKLTYIYNYLETKYVKVSSNINKNYLMNVINSINNKINDNDNKYFSTDNKNAQYIFKDKIDDMESIYKNEEDILNIANNNSTADFSSTYIFNIIIIIIVISLTIK